MSFPSWIWFFIALSVVNLAFRWFAVPPRFESHAERESRELFWARAMTAGAITSAILFIRFVAPPTHAADYQAALHWLIGGLFAGTVGVSLKSRVTTQLHAKHLIELAGKHGWEIVRTEGEVEIEGQFSLPKRSPVSFSLRYRPRHTTFQSPWQSYFLDLRWDTVEENLRPPALVERFAIADGKAKLRTSRLAWRSNDLETQLSRWITPPN